MTINHQQCDRYTLNWKLVYNQHSQRQCI